MKLSEATLCVNCDEVFSATEGPGKTRDDCPACLGSSFLMLHRFLSPKPILEKDKTKEGYNTDGPCFVPGIPGLKTSYEKSESPIIVDAELNAVDEVC